MKKFHNYISNISTINKIMLSNSQWFVHKAKDFLLNHCFATVGFRLKSETQKITEIAVFVCTFVIVTFFVS